MSAIQALYIPSETMRVQGNRKEIYTRYAPEWRISESGKGFGNWRFTKSSDILVNGVSCRDIALKHYNKSTLNMNLAKRFIKDLESGAIQLK